MPSHSSLMPSGSASIAWPLLISPPFSFPWLLVEVKAQLPKTALKTMPLYKIPFPCPSPLSTTSEEYSQNNLPCRSPPSPSLSLFVQCSVILPLTPPRHCLGDGHPWDLKANKCISISIYFDIYFLLPSVFPGIYSYPSFLSVVSATCFPEPGYSLVRMQKSTSDLSQPLLLSLLVQASISSCLDTAEAS